MASWDVSSTAITSKSLPTIDRVQLVGVMNRGQAIILDVLSPESYASAHLPGAINLPVAEIPRRNRVVLPDRDRPIIVYCGGPT